MSETQAVVTRFAPSPTGFLHIGGARTALFNWLFARHHGGKFLLRIEDTDRRRSTKEAIDAIIDGMHWLGLDWDEETHYQSEFAARHAEVAAALLASGHAYRCYMTNEELQAMRAEAEAERKPFRVRSPWRDCSPDDAPAGTPFVVRLRAPQEGETIIEDRVQGRVAVQNSELDDFVLLRSDGTPTYMLAVVVDDHDMGVTHVIRGDDHLNNAFRQLAIIRAMGWPEPVYAHVPLIHGHDGAKLSKRHGATGVDAYRDELGDPARGAVQLSAAPRLGPWRRRDHQRANRRSEWFDLDHVGRSPSRFDFKKLENLNGHYIREADDTRLAELVAPRIEHLSAERSTPPISTCSPRHAGAQATCENLDEMAEGGTFLFKTRSARPRRTGKLLARGRGLAICSRASTRPCRGSKEWTAESVEGAVRKVLEDAGVKLGQVAQPLAGGADRTGDLAGHFRRARIARP